MLNEHQLLGILSAGGGPRSLELPLGDPVAAVLCVEPATSLLGSLGHDLTVSLPRQQRRPCGEEEEREEEKRDTSEQFGFGSGSPEPICTEPRGVCGIS